MLHTIEHEVPGRVRILLDGSVRPSDVSVLTRALSAEACVEKVVVYPKIGSVAISYSGGAEGRARTLRHVSAIDGQVMERARVECGTEMGARARSLVTDLAVLAGSYLARRWFLPAPIRAVVALLRYLPFLRAALRSLARARLDVPVLDAAAIGVSLLQRDPKTAGQTMFLLDFGERLEEYTRARSECALIYSLLDIPETAQLVRGSEEERVETASLVEGDLIVVRTGMPVCVDGVVEKGCASVNQAALTGEPLAVRRSEGDDVFAGTAVEEGEIFVRVKSGASSTKLRSIVSLVEQSERCKAESYSHMERLADGIVPWNFLLAGLVALSTRSLTKASAALMVDYSCALKLASSIAVLSALTQSAKQGFTVKGSRHFEAMAEADTIVFDKTGTLTEATPEVTRVIAFGDWSRREVLRLSACLEEHFPHPVARAVVRAAEARNLKHREKHSEVEYIVAHGIASSLEGKRVVIGSEHFVVEDEGVLIEEEKRERISRETEGLSPLYLAVDGELVGVIGIEDPIKPNVPTVLRDLRSLGFGRIIMLTGDNEKTAECIARQAGVSEFHANLLPEDKHAFVRALREEGASIVMVGDGVNDSPALSEANVGIAMGEGSAIAREVAGITLVSDDLSSIVALRKLSMALMDRMGGSFAFVMAANSALLAAGIAGALSPQMSSLLHNGTTVAMSMRNAAPYRLP